MIDDIEAAPAELVSHGVDVSEVFHDDSGIFHRAGTVGRMPGPGPGGPLLLLVCLVQRFGRQRVGAPGDQDATSRA